MKSQSTSKKDESSLTATPRPSKGQASRSTILLAAAKLATTRGLDGLSIGELAAEVGMSKSGLYAHFKSKEELELATIDTAAAIFDAEVLQPAEKAVAGIARIRALVEAFLSHVDRGVFPGGCFFASVAAELGTRPGAARDRVVQVVGQWLSLLRQCLLEAQSAGAIDPKADVSQAVFEVHAMLLAANLLFIVTNDPSRLAQARVGVEHVLSRIAAPGTPLKKPSARRKP